MYAVHLTDLVVLQKSDPVGALLFPPDILGETVQIGKRIDGFAQILMCSDERARAIASVLFAKYPRLCPVRMYIKDGGWRSVKLRELEDLCQS